QRSSSTRRTAWWRRSSSRTGCRLAAELATARRRPAALGLRAGRPALAVGLATAYLSLIVLLPLAAVVSKAFDHGLGAFWTAVSGREAFAALKLTVGISLIVAVLNAVAGTAIAWVLVRD